MNEYRFRAYLKYEKKMVDVKVMDWDTEGNIIYICYSEGKYYLGYTKNDINDIIIMQWTGFRKNEEDFYERDIVNDNGRLGVIRMYNGMWVCHYYLEEEFHYCPLVDIFTRLKIVGNIYETPELLGDLKDEDFVF